VPQKEVHVERATGAEMDVCAALELFDFQGNISFPLKGVLSGGKD
jgi:hypothetical protein